MSKPRILFGASHSVIEPLGLLHLGGLARDLGWDRNYVLVKDHNFEELLETIEDYKPDIVGFNIYTGNHIQLHESYDRLKKDHPNIRTIIGGPHATYFPSESVKHADYVVMSEGFGALEGILKETLKPGIIPMENKRRFPHPDRINFYNKYKEYAASHIKSFISMTGCPYKCTYCYNSSEPEDIMAPKEIIDRIRRSMSLPVIQKEGSSCSSGKSKLNKQGYGRLFPFNVRDVDDVALELQEIVEKWPDTKLVYCQDDVHGFDAKEWLPEFAKRMKAIGIPYAAQMRWEMAMDEKRLDALKDAGCFSLTFAIEAEDYHVRKENLDRPMPEETMFKGMKNVKDRGFKIRTEQITGLPYGTTSVPTKMNLDADLGLVELNVRLIKDARGPDMAWASTLAPYKGSKLGDRCINEGFHSDIYGTNVPDTFFDRSVLRFLKEPVPEVGIAFNRIKEIEGKKDDPTFRPIYERLKNEYEILCERLRNDDSKWLSEGDLERYRDQNAELRRIFNFVTLVPEGHVLARNYLTSEEPFSYERLGRDTQNHLLALSETDPQARRSLEIIDSIKKYGRSQINKHLTNGERFQDTELKRSLNDLAPVIASLPKPEIAIDRAIKYAYEKDGRLTPKLFSTAVRHHLYDNVLYSTEDSPIIQERQLIEERYPAKI